ncbi:MAG: hypothetical protein Kow0069_38190 [Promethearchaeota archaeon]
MYSNKRLKQAYLRLRHRGEVLPWPDRSPPLPLSSGSPFLDSCVFEKIKQTPGMTIEEHLARSHQLVRAASDGEVALAIEHSRALLNDHKALLAARLLLEGDEDGFDRVVATLPFGWKLQVPATFVKPSSVFLTGWKRDVDFRLFPDVPYARLREYLGGLVEGAPEVVLLKYRAKLKTAMALLRYRVETAKERAVAKWCFDRKVDRLPDLPMIDHFLELREAARRRDEARFARLLESAEVTVPITSYVGLLGTLGVDLESTEKEVFRDYAIRCATPVESLLRLNEWRHWLTDDHLDVLVKRLFWGSDRGIVTLEKLTTAYVNLPFRLQKRLTEPVFVPLLKKAAAGVADLLPDSFEFLIPRSFFVFTNFLLYLVMTAVADGQLTTFHADQVEHHEFELDVLSEIAQMDLTSFDQYLHEHYRKEHRTVVSPLQFATITKHVEAVPPRDLLVVDLPFARNAEFIRALNQHENVFNLHSYVGLAGEVPVNPAPVNLLSVSVMGETVFECMLKKPTDAVVQFVALLQRVRSLVRMLDQVGGG